MNMETIRRERIEGRDFIGYMWTFGSHEIFEPLWQLIKSTRMTPEEYWPLLRDTWERSEVIAPNLKQWARLLCGPRRRELMMTESERRRLAALPGVLTIYRGCLMPTGANGISWTLSLKRAKFFATFAAGPRRQMFASGLTAGTPTVIRGQCKKTDVIAYLNGRKEQEILVLPSKVNSVPGPAA